MPSGVYVRTAYHTKTQYKSGDVPHNKGVQLEHVKKKIERFKLGLPIKCKAHGSHLKWRIHGGNNVQCKKCMAELQKKHRRDFPLKHLLKYARSHSKSRNRIFNLKLIDLESQLKSQNNRCIYTGQLFDTENTPSLDRINSDYGYNKDNIQFVTIRVNKMKSDINEIDFINLCTLIAGKSKKKPKKPSGY